jgi:hypothetical protein
MSINKKIDRWYEELKQYPENTVAETVLKLSTPICLAGGIVGMNYIDNDAGPVLDTTVGTFMGGVAAMSIAGFIGIPLGKLAKYIMRNKTPEDISLIIEKDYGYEVRTRAKPLELEDLKGEIFANTIYAIEEEKTLQLKKELVCAELSFPRESCSLEKELPWMTKSDLLEYIIKNDSQEKYLFKNNVWEHI